jgi:hypothetical protein
VRRLGPGDEDVVALSAERPPQTALLSDDSTIFLAAFENDEPLRLTVPGTVRCQAPKVG